MGGNKEYVLASDYYKQRKAYQETRIMGGKKDYVLASDYFEQQKDYEKIINAQYWFYSIVLGILTLVSILTSLPLNGLYYSLEKEGEYMLPMITRQHRIVFYVESLHKFNRRDRIEKAIVNDYKEKVEKFCTSKLKRVSKLAGNTTETERVLLYIECYHAQFYKTLLS